MEKENCHYASQPERNKKGFLNGLLYGLVPHTFCIGFIVFSIIGVGTATAFFRKFLLVPYLFQSLIALSFLFTTVSAVIYLKKTGCLYQEGIKSKWKYLSILYTTTVLTNLLIFFVIFPALANMNSGAKTVQENLLTNLSLEVQIPCSGHASLIIDELKNNGNVDNVNFKMPDIFEIQYNPEKTSPEKIIALGIFKTYKATIK